MLNREQLIAARVEGKLNAFRFFLENAQKQLDELEENVVTEFFINHYNEQIKIYSKMVEELEDILDPTAFEENVNQ